jgi:hypothetical protein
VGSAGRGGESEKDMRIFVGWPYDADWVDRYALPLIESHGIDVITGKELQGQEITDGVKRLISEADATLFFTTRRLWSDEKQRWETSAWVIDEIKHANSINKELVFEFREEGVEYDNKIHDQRQYSPFNSADLLACLVELGKVINLWRGLNFKVRLKPQEKYSAEFMESIRQRLRMQNYKCSFSIRQGGAVIYGPRKTTVLREGENLVIYTGDLPAHITSPGAVLEVDLEMGDAWSATRESFTTLEVVLDKL